MTYPIKVKASAAFIQELAACESGRHEDAEAAREKAASDDPAIAADGRADIEANDYQLVLCDFIERHRTLIEVRSDAELCELWYALASGTIGVNGHARTANRILDELRGEVRMINPGLVREWPCQTGR